MYNNVYNSVYIILYYYTDYLYTAFGANLPKKKKRIHWNYPLQY